MGTIKIYLAGFLIILMGAANAQTVWVADNNIGAPTGPNVFTTIQAAVDAAADGDIIQVQPSPTTYGNATIRTPNITLMGIGFNLDKDIPLVSRMGAVTLANNSDNTSNANGAIIKGLTLTSLNVAYRGGAPYFTLQNILVQNCRITSIYNDNNYGGINGLEVRDCYITSYVITYKQTTNTLFRNNVILGDLNFYYASAATITITNNILYGSIYRIAEGAINTITILNNNFISLTGSESAFVNKLKDCVISNNIFFGTTPSLAAGGSTSSSFERNIFTNNLVYSTGDNTMPPIGGGVGNSGSGNLTGSPLFINAQLLDTWSSAYDYTLQAGSPAILAGSDGTDIGITGGSYPFPNPNLKLRTTHVPVIQILNTSTVINPGDNLPVRIKANSN